MGSAMLLAECGIFEECAEKNASYCQHWISELKADSKLIVKAAGKAQRAVDHILGRQWDQSAEHSEQALHLQREPLIPTPLFHAEGGTESQAIDARWQPCVTLSGPTTKWRKRKCLEWLG